jgi:hypothetical protein
LTLSPSGEGTTQLPLNAEGDLYQIDVGGRALYLLDAPPYRISSPEAEMVRDAREYAWGVAQKRQDAPRWPGWLTRPERAEGPLWMAVDVERQPLTEWGEDEMSQLMRQASERTKYLWASLRIKEEEGAGANPREVEFVLELRPRRPEELAPLREGLQKIQALANDYDDAEHDKRDAWSPLSKVMRGAQIEEEEGQVRLRMRWKSN